MALHFWQARRRNSTLIVRIVVRNRRRVLGLLDRYSVEEISFWPCHCIFITTMVHEQLSCLCSVLVPFPLPNKILIQYGSMEIFFHYNIHQALLSCRLTTYGLQPSMSDQSQFDNVT